jgi:tetratricopeptide (TPR) repeat protein
MNLGMALAYSGSHEDAVRELGVFMQARPSPGPAHFVAGLSLLKLRRHCEAIPVLETARKWKASGEVLIELGDAYQGCNRWEQAAAAYEAAKPGGKRVRRQIAYCWWMARDYEKALPAYESAAKDYGGDGEFLYEMGDALARARGAEAGLPALEKAVAAAPTLLAARGALGRALMELGRAAEALPHLEAAAPQDPAVLLALSRAYRALGRSEEAARTEAEYKARLGAAR